MNVAGAQAILGAVLCKALGRIDHENALARGGVGFIYNNDARGNAGAIEKIGR